MREIAELLEELKGYTDEVRRLREELAPSEWGQHEELQALRMKARAAAQRVSELQEEQRASFLELESTWEEYADYCHAVAANERSPDPELMQRLHAAVRADAPTSMDDPRLAGWYHTIELGDGLRSQGRFDLGSTVDLHGFPESLDGKTALDVGTCDGFWAFEMERRGADRVVAIDVDRWGDADRLPGVRKAIGGGVHRRMDSRFWLAHAMRGSSVERRICNVYDLSPETVGVFDVVFCGSMLMHLQNPFQAVVNIRSVTTKMAIIATLLSEELEQLAPDKPWLSFGHREQDLGSGPRGQLGASMVYWHANTRALQELMEYAGFERTQPLKPVQLVPTERMCAVVAGYP